VTKNLRITSYSLSVVIKIHMDYDNYKNNLNYMNIVRIIFLIGKKIHGPWSIREVYVTYLNMSIVTYAEAIMYIVNPKYG
jgi:hypothetical protein